MGNGIAVGRVVGVGDLEPSSWESVAVAVEWARGEVGGLKIKLERERARVWGRWRGDEGAAGTAGGSGDEVLSAVDSVGEAKEKRENGAAGGGVFGGSCCCHGVKIP